MPSKTHKNEISAFHKITAHALEEYYTIYLTKKAYSNLCKNMVVMK